MYKKANTFMDSYKAYSGAFVGKHEIERGNKSIFNFLIKALLF